MIFLGRYKSKKKIHRGVDIDICSISCDRLEGRFFCIFMEFYSRVCSLYIYKISTILCRTATCFVLDGDQDTVR